MTIRKQIILLFSVTVVSVIAVIFIAIYMVFSEYREEEFQQRQKEKIKTTIKFLGDVEEMNESLAQAMDKITIHDFYDEKMLVFNEKKELIFSSIDDLPISIYKNILDKLSPENSWLETYEEEYDVVGVYVFDNRGRGYYGISKAFDEYGFTKLEFLRYILIFSFLIISALVITIAIYLSRRIAKPITAMARNIEKINFSKKLEPIEINHGNQDEIKLLVERFNALVDRTNEAFSFQKHAINHISHELKTPISVLVSKLEELENQEDITKLRKGINQQKRNTKNLANIINTLLSLSKVESQREVKTEKIRIDELIFDILEEVQVLDQDFSFNVDYLLDELDEKNLTLDVNKDLIRAALSNLILNAKNYATEKEAKIEISESNKKLFITIKNKGQLLSDKEDKYLFEYFFRGKNSYGSSGFGIGLVLAKRIINLHKGELSYKKQKPDLNIFVVELEKDYSSSSKQFS